MKLEFSKNWISSTRPGKQRKWRAFAPIHTRHALLSAHLSKDLRQKHGRRSFPLRKGDEVKIMIGKFKGKTGKVSELNTYKLKVFVDGIQGTKKDGTKYGIPLDPSNLMITSLGLDDKKRIKAIAKATAKPVAAAGGKK